MARDLGVSAAWCGAESDVDPGGGDQVGDALRTGTAAICGNERPPACGRASGAPERRGIKTLENLGSGMGRCVSCFMRILRIGVHSDLLDEVLCHEVSNLARQLKFNPEIRDNHPIIGHLAASLWFRSMDLTIMSSTSKARGPSNERKNVAAAEKQLESMGYRLTPERGRLPFPTPGLRMPRTRRRSVPHLSSNRYGSFLRGS